MIYADNFCSVCKRYHAPDRDHKDDCPEQPRVFWSRESEVLYHERKELELRHAIEARQRRETAAARELAWEKASAVFSEYLEAQRRSRFVSASEAYAQARAAYHEDLEALEAARKLLRNQRLRDRERSGEGR